MAPDETGLPIKAGLAAPSIRTQPVLAWELERHQRSDALLAFDPHLPAVVRA